MAGLQIINNISPPTTLANTITTARQKLCLIARNLRKDERSRYSCAGGSFVLIISPLLVADTLKPKWHFLRNELFPNYNSIIFLVGTSVPCHARTPRTSSCLREKEGSSWWETRPLYKVRRSDCVIFLISNNSNEQEITCCVYGRTARCLITLLTRSRQEIRPGKWQQPADSLSCNSVR